MPPFTSRSALVRCTSGSAVKQGTPSGYAKRQWKVIYGVYRVCIRRVSGEATVRPACDTIPFSAWSFRKATARAGSTSSSFLLPGANTSFARRASCLMPTPAGPTAASGRRRPTSQEALTASAMALPRAASGSTWPMLTPEWLPCGRHRSIGTCYQRMSFYPVHR